VNNDPKKALIYALEKYPERVQVATIDELALETARKNDRRPAYVKIAMPDEVVKQMRGRREGGDLTLVVHVPRQVIERSESLIVLPGEV